MPCCKASADNIVEGSKWGLVEGHVPDLNGGTRALSQPRHSVSLVEVHTVSDVRCCGREDGK